jgi:hypothetical protein
MAGIGSDIAEVIEELGSTCVILRSPTNISEKMMIEAREMVRDPAFQENHYDASLKYDTSVVNGDIVQSGGDSYLVMNKATSDFEDSIVEFNSIFLKCNLPVGTLLLTQTKSVNSTTFAVTNNWVIKKSSVYGLIMFDKRGAVVDTEEFTGKEPTFKQKCYVPASYGAVVSDRLRLSDDYFYRIENIEPHQYPEVHVLYLVEDTRVIYGESSPSTSPSSSPSTSPSAS